jgi:hypothetical protein
MPFSHVSTSSPIYSDKICGRLDFTLFPVCNQVFYLYNTNLSILPGGLCLNILAAVPHFVIRYCDCVISACPFI